MLISTHPLSLEQFFPIYMAFKMTLHLRTALRLSMAKTALALSFLGGMGVAIAAGEMPVPSGFPNIPNEQALGTGPFPAIMHSVPELPDHTIYRPANLNATSLGRMPVVVWANGACINVGNRFRWFLSELASHGFLVVAIGPIGPAAASTVEGINYRGTPATGSPATQGPQPVQAPGGPRLGLAESSPAQLARGITWAQEVNVQANSIFAGKLDTQRVAAMGQSCGGLQALALATDSRVTTLGIWNSGALDDSAMASRIAGATVTKQTLDDIRVPALYVTGDPSDVAYPNADDDYKRLNKTPVVRLWREKTPHQGTYREAGGGAFSAVGVAWLKWQLKADQNAAKFFKGPDCELCKQPEWHLQLKGFD